MFTEERFFPKCMVIIFCLLPIVNMVLIPWFYQKLWFLILTTVVTVLVGLYRFVYVRNKVLVSVIFFISICNLLVTMSGYTTKFVTEYIRNVSLKTKTTIQPQTVSTMVKGKVFVSYDMFYKPPAANAKIVFVDKKNNKEVFTSYTDVKGEFLLQMNNLTETGYIVRVEHINCIPYQTEIVIYPGMVKELEIFLQKR